jgi:hypothetical protein
MGTKCPECRGSVNVDSLCTFTPAKQTQIGIVGDLGWEPIGDFQPADYDSAHCQDDDCGWEGIYGDLV